LGWIGTVNKWNIVKKNITFFGYDKRRWVEFCWDAPNKRGMFVYQIEKVMRFCELGIGKKPALKSWWVLDIELF
jgi:hypothetical protein